jgi:acetyl/propionyl-CoA carboxylase alpha subunit
LRRALDEYSTAGIKTNAALFRRILAEPEFLRAEMHTTWLDELLRQPPKAAHGDAGATDAAAIAAALWQAKRNGSPGRRENSATTASRWKHEGRQQQLERLP